MTLCGSASYAGAENKTQTPLNTPHMPHKPYTQPSEPENPEAMAVIGLEEEADDWEHSVGAPLVVWGGFLI